MRTAIRKHLRDFVAIIALFVLATGVAAYIVSNQRLYLPGWVPGVGTDFYELDAEFQTAQAVVPGQGQTVNIAGVPVGELGKVTLEDGRAIVRLKIRQEHAPVYRDATLLLRPKTGLKDMIVEMDPGTKQAGEFEEGDKIPVAQTSPDVNLDEILAALDSDTRSYLTVLISAGGQALSQPGAPKDLRQTLKRFEPTGRDVEKITTKLAERRRNLRRVVHNFRLLTEELGDKDTQLAQLVDSSNANFDALANQDQNLRAALRELPPTLQQAQSTLGKTTTLANELGPTMESLRPTARALGPSLRQTRPFLRQTEPIIRRQLRPFSREARPAVRELRVTAKRLQPITPRLNRSFDVINALLNTLAYNPPGSEEGFLFWASWASHAGASIFATQDAHGPIRRGTVIASCNSLALLENVTDTNPQLAVLYDLLEAPASDNKLCPQVVQPGVPTKAGASGDPKAGAGDAADKPVAGGEGKPVPGGKALDPQQAAPPAPAPAGDDKPVAGTGGKPQAGGERP